jgi:hypothetical protein
VARLSFKGPEEELAHFLAALSSWERKVLLHDFPLDSAEAAACNEAFDLDGFQMLVARQEQYRTILRRIPAKWRAYREKLKKIALANVPPGRSGRPRKDQEAEELKENLQTGKSYRRIAISRLKMIPERSGDAEAKAERELAVAREAERIRKLVASRRLSKSGSTPDKI